MTYGKPLTGVCVATAAFVCSALGAPVLPGAVPPSTGSLSLSTSTSAAATFAPGAHVTLKGSGYAADANISIGVYSTPTTLDALTADASGTFSDTVVLPASLSGTHTLVAVGNAAGGGTKALEATIDVTSSKSSLPFTGFPATLFALSGVGLTVSGFALVRAAARARRRRSRVEPA